MPAAPKSIEALAEEVVALAQSRVLADLRFLSAAVDRLHPAACPALDGWVATDGRTLYYAPEGLLRAFRAEPRQPARATLHLTLHCVLGHPFQKQAKDPSLWDLACDLAVEAVIHQLELPSCALAADASRQTWLQRLAESCPSMTAEALYAHLSVHRPTESALQELSALFAQDSHTLWYAQPSCRPPRTTGPQMQPDPDNAGAEPADDPIPSPDEADETAEKLRRRQQQALRQEWKQLAQQIQTDLQTFSRRYGKRAGALLDGLAPVTFEECDYSEFLRRFGAENEVMQLSDDAFDLIYYTYGLKQYGNVPLIEPLEYRDDKRIREFVIAIDTSGSVQGDIVQRFLQRTCDVLRQSASFTTQVNIYLLQCDAEVQSIEHLTSLEQLTALIPRLRLRGFGGTDFRPVFEYVDRLREQHQLCGPDGLLYFTDGVGAYPEAAPPYKTAFIFDRDDCISPQVPSWAMRAVLTTDNIRLLPVQDGKENEPWI